MLQTTIQQLLDLARSHHGAGRLKEADQFYRQILTTQPEHADALHGLGVIAYQVGRNDLAVELMRRSIILNPSSAHYYNNLGNALKDQRQLDEAIECYRRALVLRPDYAEAHNNLGTALAARGLSDEAIACCRRALALQSGYAEAHNNLGAALMDLERLDEAIPCFRLALTLRPDYADAHYNLGSALKDLGQLDEAVACFQWALALDSEYLEAHNNLGAVFKVQKRLNEAIQCFQRALALNSNYADAHYNLGGAFLEKGRLDEAIECYRRTLALNPNSADAHYNLGAAFMGKERPDEAIGCYQRALVLNPRYAEAHNNLGVAFRDNGLLDEAIECYQRALAIKSDYPDAHLNLGTAFMDKGRSDEAIACYRRALAVKPDLVEAHFDLGTVFKDQGRLDDAIACYEHALTIKPDYIAAQINLGNVFREQGRLDDAITWFQRALALKPDAAEIASNRVFVRHMQPGCDKQAIAQECRHWNQRYAEPLRKFILPHLNDRDPERKLRLGYVSPDFSAHPVGRFLLPLIEHHDRKQFELFAYAQVRHPDGATSRLRSLMDVWRDTVGLSDEQLADQIRKDRIDILFDLAMHTAGNRLLVFARKPAPVQVTWLAYCSSTGLDAMDYRLTDPYMDPQGGDDSFYSEKTIRLPETFWCYQPTGAEPRPNSLPASEKGEITLGCLNSFAKVSEPARMAWEQILRLVPQSRLVIHAHEGNHRQRFLQAMEQGGIEARRIQFVGKLPIKEYFALYHEIDLALDPFPYGGGTTTCDALWMGVPVVSLAGETAVGRGGLSLLCNIGLPELVGKNVEDYVQIAIDLAGNLPRLTQYRTTLRERMQASPLMDATQFTRNLEAVYRMMWRKWGEGPLRS